MRESTGAMLRTYSATAIDGALVIDMVLIASLWCASIVAVNPIGDFPLIDDWSYGRTVKHLIESGEYRPLGFTSMPLITNVIWASLFCLPAGFSFTVLRLSTLLASLSGLIGIYVLVRDLQQPRWLALAIAFTVGFNPIYYMLSHTFMTDVLFTALAIWATVFLARSLRYGSDFQMLMGAALALAATLSRQLALCIPLAFAATLLLMPGRSPRTVLRALIPLILCAGALLGFNYWLAASGRLPALYDLQTNDLIHALTNVKDLIRLVFSNAFAALVHLGMFLLPVLLFLTRDLFRSHGKGVLLLIAAGSLTMVLGAAVRAHYGRAYIDDAVLMPSGPILVKSGIGPLTLRDTFVLHLDHMRGLPAGFWIVVTAMGVVGALLLIAELSVHAANLMPRLLKKRPVSDTEAVGVFLILCGIIYVLPLFADGLTYGFIDRYLVPSVPFLAVGIAAMSKKVSNTKSLRAAVFALVAAFGLFAISGTRDYLAWNRVRWQALQDLTQNGRVDAADIDGGLEFNGLRLYDPDYPVDLWRGLWWVHRDTYQIGFGAVPGYTVIKEYTYHHWLPWHVQKVVVLRKE